jgi:hypothetical protein
MTYNMTPQAIINEPYTNQEKIEKPGVSYMGFNWIDSVLISEFFEI